MGPKTPNVVVLGECGRYPLFVSSYSKCVKHWLKLLMMENGSLPKSAYNMLFIIYVDMERKIGCQWLKTFCLDMDLVWQKLYSKPTQDGPLNIKVYLKLKNIF